MKDASHSVSFTAISYILWPFLWSFGFIFPVLVCCTKKIWQPCFNHILQLSSLPLSLLLSLSPPSPLPLSEASIIQADLLTLGHK
jgi:hypothetical protein